MHGKKKRIGSSLLTLIVYLVVFPITPLFSLSKQKPQVIPPETKKVNALRNAVDTEIDVLSARLIEMNDWMYKNPEPGFLEFKASEVLTEELRKNGFVVEMGVPGLGEDFDRLKVVGGFPEDYDGPPGIPTAFKAKYKGKTEHPVVGFCVEFDALRGDPPFHGCQHNMQGPTGVGAAIALAKVMEKNNIPGSIWVVGAPAEEVGPPPKAVMAKTGYFNGADFMFRSHGTNQDTLRFPGGFTARHIRQMKYIFHGKSAHAQSPWEGRSALDAVFQLFHSIDMIREHSEPQFRFHGIVSDGGVAPNIVPELASATIWIRHLMDETPVGAVSPGKAREMIEEKVKKVDDMAQAAALATETTVDIDHYGEYNPGIAVGVLNDIVFQYGVEYNGINIGERKVPRHWEETGFATVLIPGAHVGIGTEDIHEVAGHSHENADLSVSPAGHKSLILTTKVMAATALRLFMSPDLRKKAKAEHAKWVELYNK